MTKSWPANSGKKMKGKNKYFKKSKNPDFKNINAMVCGY